jgi:hypothetical protein
MAPLTHPTRTHDDPPSSLRYTEAIEKGPANELTAAYNRAGSLGSIMTSASDNPVGASASASQL